MYDLAAAAFFGPALMRSQTCFVPELSRKKSALILGGGTGRLLLELLRYDVAESYHYLDLSEKMIRRSRKRVLKKLPHLAHRVTFECGSYENSRTYDPFDLIVTPYVLDCFAEDEAKSVMLLLYEKMKPGGEWLFADFNVSGQSAFKKFVSHRIVGSLCFFFRLVCGLGVKKLPDFSRLFSEMDLEPVREKQFLGGLLLSRLYRKAAPRAELNGYK